ncbi:RNA ligase and tail fiber protein attachment catalyst [Streptomyces phage Blueeyedbeauty]|uniref:RNA ligase n=1 Tax=Streptomyces phage Blueeyedbeauty TaxID=2250336 RepID=A0A345L1V8_9CAUD|nr:RNA ligase and tail fiber protein attachment catalyst [Streptomyces phage Blueeyedbeauty]AXH49260.1 RNA ligase [Streptomyces phage Blueeyedbeauty]
MTHVSAIFSVEELQKAIEDGWVRVQTNEDNTLSIYNYTEAAQYRRYWNDVTLNCRGLILDNDMNIVARPWKKFFNYGERPLNISTDDPVEVTDKKDGSLGILYRHPMTGDWEVATRGSFLSEQAIHATALFNDRYSHIAIPTEGLTCLFEIVYPENRIVLDYGEMDDLILLGSVQNKYGWYYGPNETAAMVNWTGPVTEVFEYRTMNEAFADYRPNAEGLVIRAGSEMLKLKQADYVALHKLVTGLNERAVWERLRDGETRDSICASLPDEFHGFVDKVADELEQKFKDIYLTAHQNYCTVLNKMKAGYSRKDFALEAIKYPNPSLLFNFLDNKSNRQSVWDMIRPKGE